jgi:hypothetical protein
MDQILEAVINSIFELKKVPTSKDVVCFIRIIAVSFPLFSGHANPVEPVPETDFICIIVRSEFFLFLFKSFHYAIRVGRGANPETSFKNVKTDERIQIIKYILE